MSPKTLDRSAARASPIGLNSPKHADEPSQDSKLSMEHVAATLKRRHRRWQDPRSQVCTPQAPGDDDAAVSASHHAAH